MHESDEKIDITHLISDLNDLVHLHFDIVASYRLVEPKAESSRMKAAVETLANEHSLHIGRLTRLIHRYGGEAARGGDLRQMGGKMRVAVGQLFRDAGMARALHALEQNLVLEYERCLRSLRAAPELEPLLDEHFRAGSKRLHEIEILCEHLERGVDA